MTSATAIRQQQTTRRRALLIGGVLPVGLTVIATALMISWLPDLPDPIAIHWSGSSPDGYGPALPMVFLPLVIGLAYSAFAIGAAWATTASGRPYWSQKFVLVTGVWLSILLSVAVAGSMAIQRGLEDARDAGDVTPLLLWGAVVGLVVAVPAWFLLPAAGTSDAGEEQPQPIRMSDSEQVSWFGTARLARAALIIIGAGVLASGAVAIAVLITAPEAAGFAIASFALLALLALLFASWHVTIDRRGLRAVGMLGWPRVAIPLDDVREVHYVEVDPAGEFGGWGWRVDGTGRSGIIMRRGPALQVTRASGKRFVVTVDDARTAASLLAALAGTESR
jgi:hypothetical protein